MEYSQIIDYFKANKNEKNIIGKSKFGINTNNSFGLSNPQLQAIAKELKKNIKNKVELNLLAEKLWKSKYHESRMLAPLIVDIHTIDSKVFESWVKSIDSWDICDNYCMNLIRRMPNAYNIARVWIAEDSEFVRRAGFVVVASLAVHDKEATDEFFTQFRDLLITYSTDDRNFVKKSVNWAIRQIGKRNKFLNQWSLKLSHELYSSNNRTARWIASNAIRELSNEKILKKIKD